MADILWGTLIPLVAMVAISGLFLWIHRQDDDEENEH